MRCLIGFLSAFVFACQSGTSWAIDDVKQFHADFLILESQQALQPERVLRYSDPLHGAALHKLLNKNRSDLVLDEYFSNLSSNSEQPDIVKNMESMLRRYEKAFSAQPKNFEQEYLDTLELTALIIKKTSLGEKTSVPIIPAISEKDRLLLQTLLDGANLLGTLGGKIAGQTIREKVAKKMFGSAGEKRALEIANRLDGGSATRADLSGLSINQFMPPSMPIVNAVVLPSSMVSAEQKRQQGARVYMHHCTVCHQGDGRGFGPIPDLRNSTKISKNETVIRMVLIGSKNGGMPGWELLSDFDVAEVVNFIKNSFGNYSNELTTPDEVSKYRK